MPASLTDHTTVDVVIAGAGMVGATAALGLARLGYRIVVIDPVSLKPGTLHYSPSYDARSTAVSWGSQDILERLGVWDGMAQHACPIRQVHVSEKGRFGTVQMRAEEFSRAALGYVVPNESMGVCLLNALAQQPNVTLWDASAIDRICYQAQQCELHVVSDALTRTVRAPLLLIVDGADSATARMLGIETRIGPYHQYAVIANVTTQQANHGVAYERFTPEGPLAMLPLAERISALVWTHTSASYSKIKNLSDDAFSESLLAQFGERLGGIERVGTRQAYPLQLCRIEEHYRPGVLILGNAAHSLHPVAGQGFNLALRGVAALLSALAEAPRQGAELGDAAFLQTFCQSRTLDLARTIHFSDQLVKTFGSDNALLSLLRDIGLVGLEALPGLKARFADMAMGLAGRKAVFDGDQSGAAYGH